MLALLPTLLLACGSPLVPSTTSAAGTWQVSLPADTFAEGAVDLPFTITTDGAPATGLTVVVHPAMEGMDHGDVDVEATEGEAGVYTGAFTFAMVGLWTLDGDLTDDATTDTFSLVVSVE